MTSVIELHPLTRVEGHGLVRVHLSGKQVERVQLSLYESPRLFEALLLGKQLEEIPEIICRICSLCSTVHRVTALLALEKALEIPVSRQTALYRELIIYGGHIQSHALHLFCMVLPDLCGVGGFADLAREAPEQLRAGLRIKQGGNMIQEMVGGRLIHPVTLVPGGMGKPAEREGLLRLRAYLEELVPDAEAAVGLFSSGIAMVPQLPSHHYLAVGKEDHPPFFGSSLCYAGGGSVPAENYRDLLPERTRSGTNAKWSYGDAFITGAIARLNLGMQLSAAASKARMARSNELDGRDMRSNSLAQAIELVHCLEHSIAVVGELLEADFHREPPPKIVRREGSGCAMMEAPRGVLIHEYSFDETGCCTLADVITPTAINQAAIEEDLLWLARAHEEADEEEMKHALEVHVRTYDPCISCAVHMIKT